MFQSSYLYLARHTIAATVKPRRGPHFPSNLMNCIFIFTAIVTSDSQIHESFCQTLRIDVYAYLYNYHVVEMRSFQFPNVSESIYLGEGQLLNMKPWRMHVEHISRSSTILLNIRGF